MECNLVSVVLISTNQDMDTVNKALAVSTSNNQDSADSTSLKQVLDSQTISLAGSIREDIMGIKLLSTSGKIQK